MRVPQAGDQFGRYRIERVLGQGGMGVVYAATDTRLGRTVAVKVITGPLAHNEEFLRRFHDEAAVLARLDSPYVIAILDHDEIDGLPYIVTQYVDGTDLGTLLRERGHLPDTVALTLCAQVARGLGDAHRAGVIHRDIKPANILLRAPGTPEMHAYLCDFGIAHSEEIDGRTATGMVAGTWAYLAPERTLGASASPASDLYALGCVLWACLTGTQPYTGTDVEMAIAHAQAPVPQLRDSDPLTHELNALLLRLLAKDPADRLPDAAAARAELERLAALARSETAERRAAAPTQVRPTQPPPPPPPPSSFATTASAHAQPTRARKRWPVVVAALAVLAVVGSGAVVWKLLASDDKSSADQPAPVDSVEGDVNDDGYGDLVVYQKRFESVSPLSVWTLASNGKSFSSAARSPAEAGNVQSGDVDGDGRPDQVWHPDLAISANEIDLTIVPGDGGDKWTAKISVDPTTGLADGDYVLADVNGDGMDDVVVGGGVLNETPGMYVAEANGHGFGELTEWASPSLPTKATTFLWSGDFDGDGTDEVLRFVADQGKKSMQILAADGDALNEKYTRPVYGAANSPWITWWATGDVDGDGADEIVAFPVHGWSVIVYDVTDDGIGKAKIWLHNDFTKNQVEYNLHHKWVEGYDLSDVDGDGDADVVQVLADKLQAFPVKVMISDGKSFAPAADWGTLPCGEDCDDDFGVVD